MKNKLKLRTSLFFTFFLIPLIAFTFTALEISIDIAPNVLNLSNKGTVVTVHTDIPYSTVEGSTLLLDGVEIQSWKSDNLGMFVAKFSINSIKALPLTVNEYHTFTIMGNTNIGDEFVGSQSILIINNSGK